MQFSRTQDAGFFELAHQINSQASGGAGRDRRRRERNSFPVHQRVAPYGGGRLPDESTFREVKCLDLSTGGFAYYTPEPPEEDKIVLGLSGGSITIYLIARVMRCTEVTHESAPLYLVGCRFTGRMEQTPGQNGLLADHPA